MSHAGVISELKALLKSRVAEYTSTAMAQHLLRESDRASMILAASTLEDFLLQALEQHMPGLNSDERSRIFHFEGPLGSFSNRIRMAHALGLIDRPTRRSYEIIKEIRNVAAHAHGRLMFGTPAIRNAVLALLPINFQDEAQRLSDRHIRMLHSGVCLALASAVKVGPEILTIEDVFTMVRDKPLPASLGKWSEA